MNKMPDATLVQKVTRQLSNHGMQSPCHIAVIVRKGDVTLSGTIQYEYQRIAAIHAARGIDGVRHVVDHLQVQANVVQKTLMNIAAPITDKSTPTMEKTAPAADKTAPTMEKAAPVMEKPAPSEGNR
jgi:hypothetical protein